jgi:hypothetical protein
VAEQPRVTTRPRPTTPVARLRLEVCAAIAGGYSGAVTIEREAPTS